MIISRGRGYVFVHIPKTGGTAMALALEARAQAGDILIGDTPKARRRRGRLRRLAPRGRLWKHSTLADIDGVLSPDEIDAMFTFTLVRNPWDRIVSYYHWLRVQEFEHPAVRLAQARDFAGFLGEERTQAALQSSPYGRYMTDATGRELCSAWLRLEHLADDLAPVEAHLGFPLRLPRVNASAREADYRGYYHEETAAIVARIAAPDIRRFGYRFDPA